MDLDELERLGREEVAYGDNWRFELYRLLEEIADRVSDIEDRLPKETTA